MSNTTFSSFGTAPAIPPQRGSELPPEEPEDGGNRRRLLLAGGAALAVALVGGGAFYFLSTSGDDETTAPTLPKPRVSAPQAIGTDVSSGGVIDDFSGPDPFAPNVVPPVGGGAGGSAKATGLPAPVVVSSAPVIVPSLPIGLPTDFGSFFPSASATAFPTSTPVVGTTATATVTVTATPSPAPTVTVTQNVFGPTQSTTLKLTDVSDTTATFQVTYGSDPTATTLPPLKPGDVFGHFFRLLSVDKTNKLALIQFGNLTDVVPLDVAKTY
ncbi:MAG: hypothetical protein ACTHMZ_02115 [Actinomycetes bacterium]